VLHNNPQHQYKNERNILQLQCVDGICSDYAIDVGRAVRMHVIKSAFF